MVLAKIRVTDVYTVDAARKPIPAVIVGGRYDKLDDYNKEDYM